GATVGHSNVSPASRNGGTRNGRPGTPARGAQAHLRRAARRGSVRPVPADRRATARQPARRRRRRAPQGPDDRAGAAPTRVRLRVALSRAYRAQLLRFTLPREPGPSVVTAGPVARVRSLLPPHRPAPGGCDLSPLRA